METDALTEDEKKLLQEMYATQHGRAFLHFVEIKMKEIDSVQDIQNYEEALGRKYAVQLIKDLFHLTRDRKFDIKDRNQYI